MSKHLKVVFSRTGLVTMQAHGFAGQACKTMTEAFVKQLGAYTDTPTEDANRPDDVPLLQEEQTQSEGIY